VTHPLETTLTRKYRFCASHRLHSNALTESENETIYGKCNHAYGHGHDYVLAVSVTGDLDPTTGLAVRLTDLDSLVKTEILDQFGHRNLNVDVAEFLRMVPTTENVAMVIAARLRARWAEFFPYSSARLSSILMQETERNGFEVVIPKASPREASHLLENLLAAGRIDESVIVNA
jgi:6-pyruvoyltetrahydropterin/6-carboxytetrahydropterin synthase